MGNRQVLVLASVLGILLILAYFSGVFGDQPSTVSLPKWKLDASEVAAVQVTNSTGILVAAERDGPIWRITEPVDAPGDSEALDRFLDQLAALLPQRIVTSNESQYASYGVDTSATKVTVEINGGGSSILLGNPGRDFATRFARINDGNHVVTLSGGLALPVSSDDWRDRTLISVQPGMVQRIFVRTPEESFAVERNGNTWKLANSGAVSDSLEMALWVDRLSNLRSDGFLPDSLQGSVADSVTHRLDLTMVDGSVQTVTFWQRQNEAAAVSSGGPAVHRVLLSSMGSIFRDTSRLLGSDE